MNPEPLSLALAAVLAALFLSHPAQARMRLLPDPLAGTGMALGGPAAPGIGLAILKARACRADPACAGNRTNGIPGGVPAPGPAPSSR